MPIKRSSFSAFHKCLLAFAGFALLVLVTGESATLNISSHIVQNPVAEERKLINITPRTVPVSVTAVRNLQNKSWLQDLEIEVRNDSDKPIYYLDMDLRFPDIPKTTEVDGIPRGVVIPLTYGRNQLANYGERATPEDIPIKAGDKYIFRIAEHYWKGFESELIRRGLTASVTKRIRLNIASIRFGDGTGFVGGAYYGTKQT